MDNFHIGLMMWSAWSTLMWWHWQKRAERYAHIIKAERRARDRKVKRHG